MYHVKINDVSQQLCLETTNQTKNSDIRKQRKVHESNQIALELEINKPIPNKTQGKRERKLPKLYHWPTDDTMIKVPTILIIHLIPKWPLFPATSQYLFSTTYTPCGTPILRMSRGHVGLTDSRPITSRPITSTMRVFIPSTDVTQNYFTLKTTSAQGVQTSVGVIVKSRSHDYPHPDDLISLQYDLRFGIYF